MGKLDSIQPRVFFGALAGIFIMLLISLTLSIKVGAISSIGPDPASHGNKEPLYTLEIKPAITVNNITVPVYVPLRPTSNVAIDVFDFKYPFGKLPNHLSATVNGSPLTGNMTVWVPPSSFTYDTDTGYYKTIVTANASGGNAGSYMNTVGFRLRVQYGGGLIGVGGGQRYSTASGTYYSGGAARFDNYAIEFATPCNITSSVTRSIELYDLDSGRPDNRGAYITIRVQDMTTGAVWSPYTTGNTGNGQTAYVHVNFEPGHKYRLLLDDVESDNTLVYTFPYDNVAYALSCQNQWTINGQSYIRSGSTYVSTNQVGKPGDIVNFKHDLRVKNGTLNEDFSWTMRGTGLRASFAPNPADPTTLIHDSAVRGTPALPKVAETLFAKYGDLAGYNASYTVYGITQADVGKDLCQYIEWGPGKWDDKEIYKSDPRCASVPYNYTLTPRIDLQQTQVEVGASVNVQGTVDNSGPTKSHNSDWSFSYVILNPETNLPDRFTAGGSGGNPCSYYAIGGGRCQNAPQLQFQESQPAAGQQVFNATDEGRSYSTPMNHLDGVEDLAVGTQICYGLSVKRDSDDSRGWTHSRLKCAVVSKRPLLQVLGGDLIVGRDRSVETGSLVKTNIKRTLEAQQYGAWAEYGILPSGRVTGMASASGYAGGVDAGLDLCSVSFLTVSNSTSMSACSAGSIGNYSVAQPTPYIESRYPKAGAEPITANSKSIDSFTSGRTHSTNSPLTLTGPSGAIPAGKWFVINAADTDVRIDTNISYTNASLGSISEIPQVIIIARNITIAESVTQVDAWLVSSGTLNTCGAVTQATASSLNAGVCGSKLTFNGPVSTSRVLLYRTAGAGSGNESGDPAEVFNLRPDAYLWASAQQASQSKARTVMTTELPPRF